MGTPPRYRWQPSTADIASRYGLRPSDVVRFDQNTSPFPTDWAPGIVAPLTRHLNEYPAATYLPLRRSIAAYVGAAPENIVAGAGIDEMILLTAKAFGGPGTRAMAAVPTYPLYAIATIGHHGEFVTVPYEDSLTFPYEEVARKAQTSNITWLCVPNNPTGERIPDTYIAEVAGSAGGVVVIDAAYAEFAGDRWSTWVEAYDNLIVLQTLSKAFGLAALRVGYSITSPDIATRLDAARPPGSISSLSEHIARLALNERSRMDRFSTFVVKERERLAGMLSTVGLEPRHSTTNFVLCHIEHGAWDLGHQLMAQGLVVRSYPQDHPLVDYLRITVRSRPDNDRLVETIGLLYPRLVHTDDA